jgi:cysteinyl-tRNA synthetase
MVENRGIMFYDTLTRRKRLFEPLEPGKVRMYVCGPTVYGDPHIGNFRSFLMGDIICRWLEYRGYNVFQVMNLTDIDDKTIRDSGKEGIPLKEFTERYTASFLRGLDRLNIKRAKIYPKATEHVPEMIEFIGGLLKKELGYVVGDGIYYDIDKFPSYGKLSGIDISEVRETERMVADEYDKETANDFALWKLSTPEELERGIFYESPWGKGRPGWHIECSVMSQKYLGETLDIHTGGEDLVFPHHENEIAQSEGLTGRQFVRFWMHVRHLMINSRKMSKSLGNYVSFDDVLSRYSADAFRYFYLSTHYRRQIDYTEDAMRSAENSAQRLRNTLDLVEESLGSESENLTFTLREDAFLEEVEKQRRVFEEAMDDDLDTHTALGALHAMSGMINVYAADNPNKGVLLNAQTVYRKLFDALGLFEEQHVEVGVLADPLIKLIVELREGLRVEKNYKLADTIRDKLAEIGVVLSDKPGETSWRIEGH